MTTIQHTSGPWKAGRQSRETGNIDITAGDTLVAIITCEEWGYGGKVSRKEAAANARRVEAVPKLLAALKQAVFLADSLHHLQGNEEAGAYAAAWRGLLDKATGMATQSAVSPPQQCRSDGLIASYDTKR